MQLDMSQVALRLGFAILEKMAAEYEAQQLGEELVQANMRIIELEEERGDADGKDPEGDGNQGA